VCDSFRPALSHQARNKRKPPNHYHIYSYKRPPYEGQKPISPDGIMIKRTTKAGLAQELEALQSMEKEYRYVNQAFAKGVEPERTAIMGKKVC
jgi:hypothetical protein